MRSQSLDCRGFKQVFERVDQRHGDNYVVSDEDARSDIALLEAHASKCLPCQLRMEMLDPKRAVLSPALAGD